MEEAQLGKQRSSRFAMKNNALTKVPEGLASCLDFVHKGQNGSGYMEAGRDSLQE
jgi:hypothetical protein